MPSIPRENVVLEASAGTGKTRVLVERYVNLLAGRRRSRPHPRDHVHAQGRGRDAAADRRAAEGSGPDVRARRRALAGSARAARRHRHLDDRRVLPRAAARVSARGRRRSRASSSPTTPRCRGSSRRRSTWRCGSAAASPGTTTMWRWCSRSWASGGCAPGWRRCSAAGWSPRACCGGTWRPVLADLTAAVACRARPRDRLALLRRRARRARGVSRNRAAGDSRSSRCWPATSRGLDAGISFDRASGQAAFRVLVDRLRGYFLTQEGKPRGEASPAPASGPPTASPRRHGSGIARRRRRSRP